MSKNNYVYVLDGKLYINLTNLCTNDCVFCIRSIKDDVVGANLFLDSEKLDVEEVKKQLDDIKPMESSTQLQENRNGSIPLLDEYIKSRRSNDDPFTIDVDQHGNKVEIHETHTYQTQMQSSIFEE